MEKLFDRRSPPNLRSKFSTLPSIGKPHDQTDSPTPNTNNQIVPYGAGGTRSSLEHPQVDDKMRQLENRVSVAERSNRAMLEEIVRLQAELKGSMRRNEESIREERESRKSLESSLRASNDLISQLNSRFKTAEEKSQEQRNTIAALSSHTKTIEQSFLSEHQDTVSRKNAETTKVDEMTSELSELSREKNILERTTYKLAEELRQLKSQMDSQTREFSLAAADVRTKYKQLEQDSKLAVDFMRKQGETQNNAVQSTSQLRGQMDTRLVELRDVIVDLRNKQNQEAGERRTLQQQVQVRLADLSTHLSEQKREREEALHAVSMVQREREHAAETERIKLQGKIAQTAEEVSKKIMEKEMKLRDESQSRFAQIDQMFIAEQEARLKFEKDHREEIENRMDAFKKLSDDEIRSLRDQIKNDRKKTTDTLRTLNNGAILMERQLEEQNKHHDKILAAEIQSRKHQDHSTQEKINDIHEKISVATSTLQQAIGGLTVQMGSHSEKIRREVKNALEDHQGRNIRTLADMDSRITSLNKKIDSAESALQAKLASESANQADTIEEKLEGLATQQEETQQTVTELQSKIDRLPDDVFEIEQKLEDLKTEMTGLVSDEGDERNRAIEKLTLLLDELTLKVGDGKPTTEEFADPKLREDVNQCQAHIRKLAESMQTVKTVLGMKIQSEQKVRVDALRDLSDDISNLRSLVEPLLNIKPEPRIFIKPDNWEEETREIVEEKSTRINKWSMYTAYRWLFWKKALNKLRKDFDAASPLIDSDDEDSKKSRNTPTDDGDSDSIEENKPKSESDAENKSNLSNDDDDVKDQADESEEDSHKDDESELKHSDYNSSDNSDNEYETDDDTGSEDDSKKDRKSKSGSIRSKN